jgi:hypothetical protein
LVPLVNSILSSSQPMGRFAPPQDGALWGMPTVTRRRDPDAGQEAWLIFYGDICVAGIAARTGNPDSTDPWQWRCGF